MILVDTSVWVDHLRKGVPELAALLDRGEVLIHPFVVGDLACGNLSSRDATVEFLGQLHSAAVADHAEVMAFIETR